MVKIRVRGGRPAAMAALLAAMVGLSGCGSSGGGPIQWYRDLSGASVNDPKDKGANATNLAEGGKEPYPNLASVPPAPDTAITSADRKKMAQSLIADRQNAQYTDQQLRAGQNLNTIAPPPVAAAAPPPAAPQVASAAPMTAPAPTRRASPPVAAPRAPVHEEALPTAAAPPPQRTATAVPAPASPPDTRKAEAKKKKDQKKQAQRRGAVAPPRESSLRPPSIDNLPRGEEAKTAPPPPAGSPATRRHSEQFAAAAPAPGDAEASQSRAVTGPVAQIKFSPAPFRARILPAGQKRLAEVARMAQQQNVRIRVVGYGAAPSNSDKQQRELQSFNAALDNAKAVGIELAKLGVPAGRIDIETSTDINAADHAEVYVEY